MLAFLTEQRRRLFNGKLSIYKAKEALTAISSLVLKRFSFDGRADLARGGGKNAQILCFIRSKY
jgi:hypothetical protein